MCFIHPAKILFIKCVDIYSFNSNAQKCLLIFFVLKNHQKFNRKKKMKNRDRIMTFLLYKICKNREAKGTHF